LGDATHLGLHRIWEIPPALQSAWKKSFYNTLVSSNLLRRAFLERMHRSMYQHPLNFLEDFQLKKRPSNQQNLSFGIRPVEAYDSVQAYTIQASLERFTSPNDYQLRLSNLKKHQLLQGFFMAD